MLFPLLFWIPSRYQAQITLGDTLDTNTLIGTLFGTGVEVTLDTIICDTNLAIREFDGTNTNLDLYRGMLISTGLADSALGPNPPFGNQSFPLNVSGYAPLAALAGNQTFDACIIKFDIVPQCDSIGIRYVFASEEYNEFVNSFNDIFAFFISGPGYSAPAPGQNIALVPGTTQPVSINNVNNGNSPGVSSGPCTNCQYFVDNVGGQEVEFDGYTVPMIAGAAVTPCETYHITIAIADVLDDVVDSGVFLEVGGISCLSGSVDIRAMHADVPDSAFVIEGCDNSFGLFSFTLGAPLLTDETFHFTIAGTATPGVDYVPLADSITIPAGSLNAQLPVAIINDNIPEGTETIELIYRDSTACSTSAIVDTIILEIRDFPANILSLNDTFTCSGIAVTIGIASDPAQTYSWTPIDYLSDPLVSQPFVVPPDQMTYPYVRTYTLQIDISNGVCVHVDSMEVEVRQGNFGEVTSDSVCLGLPTNLTTSSVGLPISTWDWQLGDGNTSTISNPSNIYPNAGTTVGMLIATNTEGCTDSIPFAVEVHPLPVTQFEPQTVCLGDSVFFNNQGDTSDSLKWDFGDGSGVAGIYSPSHLYTSTDTFGAVLYAMNAFSCVDSQRQDIWVTEVPLANFIAFAVCQGDSTQFINQSVPQNGFSFGWDFGDGFPMEIADSPRHLYGSFGLFDVQLIAQSPGGCVDTVQQTVEVLESPNVSFAVDSVCDGTPVSIMNLSTASSPIAFDWDFGDGTTSTDPFPSHTYLFAGPFTMIGGGILDNGCVSKDTQVVEVYPLPNVSFTQDSACEGSPTFFQNQTIPGVSSNMSYNWNLGFNTFSTEENPQYTFPQAADYQVSLQVIDSLGCEGNAFEQVHVRLRPQADFAIDDGCTEEPVVLSDSSETGGADLLAFAWTDDQGGTFEGQNPIIEYTNSGNYVMTLVVIDAAGCQDTASRPFALSATPQAAFLAPSVCLGAVTVFQNTTVADPGTTYEWALGNGTTSTEEAPIVTYPASGTYNIRLIATSTAGCSDTVEGQAIVFDPPQALFSVDDVCENFTSVFQNLSQRGDGNTLFYNWIFGDNQTSTERAPEHIYNAFGNFNPSLILADENGCADTLTLPHRVFAQPVATFTVEDVCESVNLNIRNQTVDPDLQGIASYTWDYGNGVTASVQFPTYAYPASGTYDIQLVAQSRQGCKDTTVRRVTVASSPSASFTYESACFPDFYTFTNTSVSDPGDQLVAANWDWGDGTMDDDLLTVDKAFGTSGLYDVQLSMTTDKGCLATYQEYVVVSGRLESPLVFHDTVCFGTTASLRVQPPQVDAQIQWYRNFGDTEPFQTGRVYLIPQLSSEQEVWVEAVSPSGCISDRLPIHAMLRPGAEPEILTNDTLVEIPAALVQLEVIGGDWESYTWDLDNGVTSRGSAVVYEYQGPGRYNVQVK
ncbi:MAG: PKD domain-containing protein, partial [Bacteroidota bacterium]